MIFGVVSDRKQTARIRAPLRSQILYGRAAYGPLGDPIGNVKRRCWELTVAVRLYTMWTYHRCTRVNERKCFLRIQGPMYTYMIVDVQSY